MRQLPFTAWCQEKLLFPYGTIVGVALFVNLTTPLAVRSTITSRLLSGVPL